VKLCMTIRYVSMLHVSVLHVSMLHGRMLHVSIKNVATGRNFGFNLYQANLT
jgi:hypothetical protein